MRRITLLVAWLLLTAKGLLFFAAVANEANLPANRQLVVGIYQNPPKILVNADGTPTGIFGDLLTRLRNSRTGN
ncbi:hypothetical protein [Arsukibacterium sp.]|uniref:hypothetical protein n=1 Tax=Arsukibacterium sp. TaxID=1977258 RepID=UPI0026117F9B|nr:hypothetical protein [Arsukibacterium sp.]